MKWISVKDRLPDDEQWVMAYGSMEYPKDPDIFIRSCKYYSQTPKNKDYIRAEECWAIEIDGLCCYGYMDNVTHWMPLPLCPCG